MIGILASLILISILALSITSIYNFRQRNLSENKVESVVSSVNVVPTIVPVIDVIATPSVIPMITPIPTSVITPTVTVQPRPTVVSRGSVDRKVDKVKVDVKPDFKYIDSFTADVTAYTLFPAECGFKYPGDVGYGVTASGKYVIEGTTIATSDRYKFGTKIKIEGFKYTFIVMDRGGDIKNNRIDVFMNSRTQAFNFGRKKLKAYIIAYGK